MGLRRFPRFVPCVPYVRLVTGLPLFVTVDTFRPVVPGNFAGHNYSGMDRGCGKNVGPLRNLEHWLRVRPGTKGALGPWAASVLVFLGAARARSALRCGVSTRDRGSCRGVACAFFKTVPAWHRGSYRNPVPQGPWWAERPFVDKGWSVARKTVAGTRNPATHLGRPLSRVSRPGGPRRDWPF